MAVSTEVHATYRVDEGAIVVASVTLDSSYPTGGEALDADEFGLRSIDAVVCGGVDDATYHAHWVRDGRLLKMYVEDGTSGIEAEVANTTDLSAVVVPVIAIGKV